MCYFKKTVNLGCKRENKSTFSEMLYDLYLKSVLLPSKWRREELFNYFMGVLANQKKEQEKYTQINKIVLYLRDNWRFFFFWPVHSELLCAVVMC